jgi:Zn ribbon nucleic-acid-binding protein
VVIAAAAEVHSGVCCACAAADAAVLAAAATEAVAAVDCLRCGQQAAQAAAEISAAAQPVCAGMFEQGASQMGREHVAASLILVLRTRPAALTFSKHPECKITSKSAATAINTANLLMLPANALLYVTIQLL